MTAWPDVAVTLFAAGFSADLGLKTASGAFSTDLATWLDIVIPLACWGWEPFVPDLAAWLILVGFRTIADFSADSSGNLVALSSFYKDCLFLSQLRC